MRLDSNRGVEKLPDKNRSGKGVKTLEIDILVGGFKYFSCSPLFGEDFHFEEIFFKFFQMG